MSKLYAHLGTILAAVGAGGVDFGAFHANPGVQLALTIVAGILVACHILSPAAVGSLVADARRFLAGAESLWADANEAYRTAIDAARAVKPTPAAPATPAAVATPAAPAAPAAATPGTPGGA